MKVIGPQQIGAYFNLSEDNARVLMSNALNLSQEVQPYGGNISCIVDVDDVDTTKLRITIAVVFKTGYKMYFKHELISYDASLVFNGMLNLFARVGQVFYRLFRSFKVIYNAIREYRNDSNVVDNDEHVSAYIECILECSKDPLTADQLYDKWVAALKNRGWQHHFDQYVSNKLDPRIDKKTHYLFEFEIMVKLLELELLKVRL